MRVEVSGYNCSNEETVKIIKEYSCTSFFPVADIEIENSSIIFDLNMCGLNEEKIMAGIWLLHFCEDILGLLGKPFGFTMNFPEHEIKFWYSKKKNS